jgi:hypothetical protein
LRCGCRLSVTGFEPDTAPMTGDDIVRRAGDHLERTIDRVLDEERQPPEATRVTVADFDGGGDINHDHVEIDCDICEENVAIAPGLDGWKTQEQQGPSEQPHRALRALHSLQGVVGTSGLQRPVQPEQLQ